MEIWATLPSIPKYFKHLRFAAPDDNGYSYNTMPLEVIEMSDQHRDLLRRLAELIPDLDPDAPQSLQRIFGLGLIALTLQITNKARAQEQDELVAELGDLAREMVEIEESDPD